MATTPHHKSADPEVRGVTRRVVSLWYLGFFVIAPPSRHDLFFTYSFLNDSGGAETASKKEHTRAGRKTHGTGRGSGSFRSLRSCVSTKKWQAAGVGQWSDSRCLDSLGAVAIWGCDHLGLEPFGPGAIWAWSHLGL